MKYKLEKQFRLKDYDYAQSGYYFVTICTKEKRPFLGEVFNEQVRLSKIGKIAERNWLEIPKYFKHVLLDLYAIMPNHIHGIVVLNCKQNLINQIPTNNTNKIKVGKSGIMNNPMESQELTLGKIIRWYKAKVSYAIRSSSQSFCLAVKVL